MKRQLVMEKIIRSTEIGDAEAVRDIYAPFVSDNATSFEIEPPDVPAMEQRIRTVQDQYPWLVYVSDEKVLGYAYASRHRERKAYQWCVEVSVYVHASALHCGIGRALYLSLFEILRRQGCVNAYAGITLPNPPSIRLHESLGFQPIGVFTQCGFKLGRWHDVAWLQLRLLDAPVPIPNLRPAREILADDSIKQFLLQQAQAAYFCSRS
jgi:L-amino acid N-acyltransferase YncA